MTRAYNSAVIDAPIEQVWQLVSDFGQVHAWFTAIKECQLEAGMAGNQVGAVRKLAFDGDVVVREQLLEYSLLAHSLTYTVLDGIPHQNYFSTLKLTAVTASNSTLVEWSADFDCAEGSNANDEVNNIVGAFQFGFDQLAALVHQ